MELLILTTRFRAFACMVLTTAAAPNASAQTGPETYRTAFEAGVAALEAGRTESAAGHFRSAGEFAPEAPVWKAYLARAEGRTFSVAAHHPGAAGGAWVPVGPRIPTDAIFDPTGERLLTPMGRAGLWDARTGDLIAALTHRFTDGHAFWRFDESGRLLIGVSREARSALDIRDARTGDPLEVVGAEELRGNRVTRFAWSPADEPGIPMGVGRVVEVAVLDGILRCQSIGSAVNQDVSFSADDSRVLVLDRSSPTTLTLFDNSTGDKLASISPGGYRAEFSLDGRHVLANDNEQVIVLDSRTGERLEGPPVSFAARPAEWTACSDGERVLIVDRHGEFLTWDPTEGAVVSRLELVPAPEEGVSQIGLVSPGLLIVNSFASLRAYDAATGREVWSRLDGRFEWHGYNHVRLGLSPDHRHIATGGRDGAPEVLDLRSGATLTEFRSQPLGTGDIEVLHGADACVLAASDGSLRRVALKSGDTTTLATQHAGTSDIRLQSIDARRLASWDDRGRLFVRDAQTLMPSATLDLGASAKLLALSPDGRFCVARDSEARPALWALKDAARVDLTRDSTTVPRSASFSPEGRSLVIAYPGTEEGEHARLHWFDPETGDSRGEIDLGHVHDVGPVEFCGEDRVAVAWWDFDSGVQNGVDVFDLSKGTRVARLQGGGCLFGGFVGDLRCEPDLGRIVHSLSSCGVVVAHDTETWKEVWRMDYGGGNPSPLYLQRPPESDWLYVSGMSPRHARCVDLATGGLIVEDAVRGYDLDGSTGNRFAVGRGPNGGMVVVSGLEFEHSYVRTEGPGSSAWVIRNGTQVQMFGAPAPGSGVRHLLRDGVSRPVDCWDAWLLDPLGLMPVDLNELPTPPRIAGGPPRRVGVGSALEFEVVGERGPIRMLVLGPGISEGPPDLRPSRPTLYTLPERGPTSERIEIPRQLLGVGEFRFRAIDRSGVMSAPWVVDVE